MGLTQRITWEPLRSINSTDFNDAYQALETPLVHNSYICKLVNNSNVLVTISIDGATDIDVAPANSFWLYDETKSVPLATIPSGTQFYVKGASGGTNAGLVYLVTQYIITV